MRKSIAGLKMKSFSHKSLKIQFIPTFFFKKIKVEKALSHRYIGCQNTAHQVFK
jgi:hypothetical protein